MKTYYCVVTSCFDDGRVTANIVDTKQADKKPESESRATRRADIYVDWYETPEAAQQAVNEARAA